MNPEGLTREEILRKIKHLEQGISYCLMFVGGAYCQNRIKRVELLKTYL